MMERCLQCGTTMNLDPVYCFDRDIIVDVIDYIICPVCGHRERWWHSDYRARAVAEEIRRREQSIG